MNGFSGTVETACTSDICSRKIECGECQKKLRDPRVLPCLHTFCLDCLRDVKPYVVNCDSDLASGSSASGSGSLSSKSSTLTILCPTCVVEVELPEDGVEGLPVNFVSQKLLLLQSLNEESSKLQCDLCDDSSPAAVRCEDCSIYMCSFCLQAHKRQRKTSSHTILTIEEAREKGVNKIHRPVFCSRHINEELRMFCETCDETVCRDCCLVEHREHKCDFIDNVCDGKMKVVQNLLSQTKPHIDVLRVAIDGVKSMQADVKEKSKQLNADITYFIDSYIHALQKHKDYLLSKVAEIAVQKENVLQLQKIQLEQTLGDFEDSCEFVSDALNDGSGAEILSFKKIIINRLKELNSMKYTCEPKENAFIRFDSEETAGLVDGYEVKGNVIGKEAQPLKCIAKGEGLSFGKQGERSEFMVMVKHGRNNLGGKEYQLKVEMVAKDNQNRKVKVDVANEKNGIHSVSYVPPVPGQYLVIVYLNGRHIQGSPFTVNVQGLPPLPIQRASSVKEMSLSPIPHSGIWHCCTFCSSEGNKNAICGCGGNMPGGFKGCGHGHPGHPGGKHWSCCGQSDIESSCDMNSVNSISTSSSTSALSQQFYTLPKSFKTVAL
ncbi:E3 ubiquitin-protein ligase TRIM45-like [Ptychodera flava]|uniref:E3 ubiquitin-protein ligase TRIM45-like n=1 Tax=Ptychodera flava TaxID=63121 RepID=UPI00396A04BB